MNLELPITESSIPQDGLRFFHGLSNWVEQSKVSRPHLIGWKKGQKQLVKLKCIKPRQKESFVAPSVVPDNSIYVPISSCGMFVIKNLRHAFCHNDLTYDETTKQYEVKETGQVKIAGRFSLDAIKDFVSVYLQSANNNNNSIKSK